MIEGIATLFDLHKQLMNVLLSFDEELNREDSLIHDDEQVFISGDYQKRIGSPIITTGNELVKQQIADFSKELNLKELYSYITAVKDSTERILKIFECCEYRRKCNLAD